MQINVRVFSLSLHDAVEEFMYSDNSGERESAESPLQFQEATIVHPEEADLASLPGQAVSLLGQSGFLLGKLRRICRGWALAQLLELAS